MNAFLLATPLIALDAVALDTEATSLNPSRARLVEFGALHLNRGEIRALDTDLAEHAWRESLPPPPKSMALMMQWCAMPNPSHHSGRVPLLFSAKDHGSANPSVMISP